MKLGICGPGRCGKDTISEWFDRNTILKYSMSTSEVIAPYVAERLGISVFKAFSERHNNRKLWFDVGNELRKDDPVFLVKKILKTGDIIQGMRNRIEIIESRKQGLINLFIWIQRDDIPNDPTLEYSKDICDIIIENNSTMNDLFHKLTDLSNFARILKEGHSKGNRNAQ